MSNEKLNICIIIVDSLRADHLSCYGYNKNTSPNIDIVSKAGVRFNNAFSQSNWTYPSLYSFISGRYPGSHRITWFDQRINEKFVTFPALLKEYGYQTALFSSFRTLTNPTTFGSHFQETYLTDIDGDALQRAKDWFNGKGKSLLMLHIGDYVHEPYYADKKFVDMFYQDGYQGLEFNDTLNSLVSVSMRDSGEKMRNINRQLNLHTKRLSKKQLSYVLACYDAGIFYVDKFIGELYKILQKESEKFLFIVTADHGQAFFEHGFYGHGMHLHEEFIKVPLVIATEQGNSGVFQEPVQHIDIYPSLLELLGVDNPAARLDGVSFAGGLYGKDKAREGGGRFAVSEARPFISIRNNKYKLITSHFKIEKNSGGLKEISTNAKSLRRILFNYYALLSSDKLYNILDDPQEKCNIVRGAVDTHKIFTEKLEAIFKKIKHDAHEPSNANMDEEIKRQLVNLGYM